MNSDEAAAKLPAYTRVIYGETYNDLDKSEALDTPWSTKVRSLFQYNKLVAAALRNIKMNQSVLQLGLTFGNQIDEVAQRVGAYGQYDIIDINSLQVSRNQEKYGRIYPSLQIIKQDAACLKTEVKYDTVLCFMLLQELPPATKAKVINNALDAVKPGGAAVFIDYHNPLPWHPLRYWVRMFNRLRHPFVEKLWDRDIDTYAQNKTDFVWRKSTYFGRMFQKVVATRKSTPLEQTFAAESVTNPENFLPDF